MLNYALLTFIILQHFAFAAFFSYRDLPSLSVGGVTVGITDLLLITSLILLAFKLVMKSGTPTRSSRGVPFFVIFLFFGFISFLVGAFSSNDGINHAVRESRHFFLYFVFLMVSFLDVDEKNLVRMSHYIVLVGFTLSLVSILIQTTGFRLPLIAGKVETLQTAGVYAEGVKKIAIIGFSTVNFAFFLSFFSLVCRFRLWTFLLFISISLGMLLSFSRGAWLGSFIALAVSAPFVSRDIRRTLYAVSAVGLVIVFFLTLGSALGLLGQGVSAVAKGATERMLSLQTSSMGQDMSVISRIDEAKMVLKKVATRPFWGHGLGAIAQEVRWRTEAGREQLFETGYIHNGYLNMTFKLGLFGLVSFLLFAGVFALSSFRLLKRINNHSILPYCLAAHCYFISIIPHSIASPRIMEGKWIINFAIAMGIVELSYRLHQTARKPIDNKLPQLPS
jgi:O-antigen ligase